MANVYGQKPGHKRRGSKPHYTQTYPKSLLGGLLFCKSCGSRLWVQGGDNRFYMGCPNHRKGTCGMASRVPVPKAEEVILGFVSELLSAWPGWLQAAANSMRIAVNEFAAKIPEGLRADQNRLDLLEKQVENLVDLLANGSTDSPALRRRLEGTEREVELLRVRIEERRHAQKATGAMPDDAWVRDQLLTLQPLLQDDPGRTSLMLRRLMGRVTAEAVVPPGKSRGFMRLHFRVAAMQVLKEALSGRLPEAILSAIKLDESESDTEFHLDLGEPTRLDALAPEIAAMRDRGMKWAEICSRTGLGTGNAYNIWKRWSDAQPTRSTDMPEPRKSS